MIDNDLDQFLRKYRLLSLATFGETPWVANVFYVSDKDGNLYISTDPSSEHMLNTKLNTKVACAIYDSTQNVSTEKTGIQLYGIIEEVSLLKKVKVFIDMWNKLDIDAKKLTVDDVKGEVFVIRPMKIKFYNTVLYGKEKFKVWEF